MRNGRCAKCDSETVFSQPGGIFFYTNALHVRTSSLEQGVSFNSYICTTCGYFENYVNDPQKLVSVTQKWQKVSPTSKL